MMVEEETPIVIMTSTRLRLDAKGGVIGLKLVEVKKEDGTEERVWVPAIMELAQAKEAQEEGKFQALGFEDGDGVQLFNTNGARD
jgi:hypothetical protein